MSAGDFLVSYTYNIQQWPMPKDVQIMLTYPPTGLGARLTHVSIHMEQDTDQGNAYVVAGDRFERMIVISLEAYDVQHVSYIANFYGV